MSTSEKSFPYLIVISLCANMLLLGAVGGMWLKSNKSDAPSRGAERQIERRMGGPIEERIARAAMDDLPRDERREFRKKLGMEWRSAGDLRSEMIEIRKNISEAMSSETYDAEAVAKAFDALRNKENEVRARFHTSISDYLASLSDEDRLKLIERAEQRKDRRFERRDGDDHRPPPPPDGFDPDDGGPPPKPPGEE